MMARWLRGPLFCCGFRPFFLLAALHAMTAMAAWGLFLDGRLFLPPLPGGPVPWHMHEMLFGFAMAAVAGFLLTAVPEFTGSPPVQHGRLALLAALWLAARLAYLLSGALGVAPAGLLELSFMAYLAWLVIPPLWRDPERPHLSFGMALLTLTALDAGFFIELARGEAPERWGNAAAGTMMILVIVALSRISMRIVNDELALLDEQDIEYRARPPRRNLAIFTIAMSTAAEFFLPGNAIGGWLALAAAAAILNLLNDWHVGRVLFRRRVLPLYTTYVLMAAGYALIGMALLGAGFTPSAGRHLLLAGTMSLAVLVVMVIAGRAHGGHGWEIRPWVSAAALVLLFAAPARAAAGFGGVVSDLLLLGAAAVWPTAFALYLLYSWGVLVAPRPDGGQGCDEVVSANQTSTPTVQPEPAGRDSPV